MFFLVWLVMILLVAGAITGAVFALYYNNRIAEIFAGLGFGICVGVLTYLAIPDTSVRNEVQKVLSKPEAPVQGQHYEVTADGITIKEPVEGCEIVGIIDGQPKAVLKPGSYALSSGKSASIWFQNQTDPPTSRIVEVHAAPATP